MKRLYLFLLAAIVVPCSSNADTTELRKIVHPSSRLASLEKRGETPVS